MKRPRATVLRIWWPLRLAQLVVRWPGNALAHGFRLMTELSASTGDTLSDAEFPPPPRVAPFDPPRTQCSFLRTRRLYYLLRRRVCELQSDPGTNGRAR